MTILKMTAMAGLGTALLAVASVASAVSVECGNAGLGTRTLTVDPALAGGLCYAQEGNLQNADYVNIGVPGLVEIEKDVVPDGGNAGSLQWTITEQGVGTFSYSASLWTTYSRLFFGTHFGGGSGSPDSFVVELDSAAATSGTYVLNPAADRNGLSNVYLFGVPGTTTVPEPTSLALLGLGLAGLGFARRRRSK